ncbi:MAG: fatty acyl-CoA synthetase [Sphingobium sp.]
MASPEIAGIARRQTLYDVLERSAVRQPEKLAISCGHTEWSYRAFADVVLRLAGGLNSAGIGIGDRVAVLSRNSHWFMALRFAVARAGAVFVPINFMLNETDTAYIVEHCEAKALFIERSCMAVGLAAVHRIHGVRAFALPDADGVADIRGAEPFEALLQIGEAPINGAALDGKSLAQIIYTSGTESRPKGAMLTHEAIIWQYQSCLADCDWQPSARVLNALPLFHCAQLDTFLGPSLHIGGSNWIISAPEPSVVLPMIEREGITSFFAPPTVWISLLRAPLFDQHDLSSLTHGYYGASIMPVEVLAELRQRLPQMRLWNCYGQTEIAPLAVVLQPEDQVRKAGAAGRAVLHVRTRLVDDAMNDVAPGEVGEIVHQSPQLMTGYWRDPERTAEAFAGGWFHSGDLGVIDDEGFITVVDRKKDMIKSGGENVASREVEEVLYGHPAISEAAVIGMPDPKWIERVTAIVVLRAGACVSADDVISHCTARLSSFKVPKEVVFEDNLPRNASGKILKRELRERLAAAKASQARP